MQAKQLIKEVDSFVNKIASLSDEKLKELSKINSFAGRIRFCDANFVKLKAGSSRIAYAYTSDLVIKLAKNEKGIAQNSVEADGFIQQHYKDLVANVLDSDPNNYWLVAEKAVKITPSQFKHLAGFSILNMYHYLLSKFENRKNMIVDEFDKINESEMVHELMDLMANFSMPSGDMGRVSSWGKVRDRLVLIDYGLTDEIKNEYY